MYTTITVKQILDRKGYDVWSLDADTSVLEALEFMAEKNIGAVMVTRHKKPVGIFSERDYARKVALKGRNERTTRIAEVMTSQVIGVELHYELEMCLALMTDKFIRHLPVVDDEDQIIGVISIGDIVKQLILEQRFMIDQLIHYITGEQIKPPVPKSKNVELP